MASAAFTFSVSINTSSIGAIPGFLDLQLNPFGVTSPDATADISSFTTDAVLTTADPGNFDCTGGPFSTGPLPADLTLCAAGGNGSDYAHNITDFGTFIQFNLALTPTGGTANDTTFGMALYENHSPFPIPHLNDGSQGDFIFTIDLHPNGTYTLNNASGGAAVITDTTPVPEPATFVLLGAGLIGLFFARKNKKTAQLLVIAMMCSTAAFAAEPLVKTVPWKTADPSVPHDTFAYKNITLKGTSSLAGSNIRATWEFGDGTDPQSFTVQNPYDVSTRHVYFGATGTIFTAQLTVMDTDTGESSSANYLVAMRDQTIESETKIAIDEGLWYLHTKLNRTWIADPAGASGADQIPAGDWRGTCKACDDSGLSNAGNVLVFERNGHLESGDSANPYTETVARAMRALLSQKTRTRAFKEAILAAQTPNSKLHRQILDSMPTLEASPLDFTALLGLSTDDALGGSPEQQVIDRQDAAGFWAGHAPDTSNPAQETSLSIQMLTVMVAHSVFDATVTNVSSKVNVTSSGPLLNRSTGTWNSNLSVTNTSGATITGPVSVGLHITPGTVNLVNNNGAFNGDPYRSITAGDMTAGQAITVVMQYSAKPSSFVPTTYAGTMPPGALAITCPTATANTGTPYSSAYGGSGGVLAYTYSTVGTPPDNTLPHNLTLDTATGAVTGTPDTPGNSNFTAKVTDAAGPVGQIATAPCSINVTAGNTAPVANPQSPSTNEDTPLLITLTGSDADSNPLTFAIVPATGPTHGSLGSITPINATSASVQYTPSADYNGPDSFQFKVNDGTVDSTPATVSITVIAVNDRPVVTAGATLAYTENDAATVIDNTITVNDVDSANLVGATVQISGGLAEDVLSFTNNSGVSFVSYSGGLLTLTGTTTLANYQAALRAVKYNNTSENPSIAARTVTWVVNDGSASNNLSTGVTSSIGVTAVNDKPVVTAGATLNYTENAIATVIDNTITVNDVDSTNLVGATAQISGGLAEDVLSFTNANGVSFVSYAAGLLTLSGTTTPANYQAALRTVKYNNTSDNPSTAARTVTWVVNDGAGANNLSTGVTSTVNVTAVNDKPVVTAGATLAYTENDGATVIDGTITVNDVDSPNLVGATVQISGGLAEDVLSFSNNSGVSFVSYSGGLLTLTGTTTPANYQTALRTVAYRDTSDNPSTVARTVTWVVDDGAAANHLSTGVTSTINITAVNDAPVLATGSTLAYTENDAATAINTLITVNDVDSTNLIGATVQITGNLHNAEDVLSFTNANGISGVFTSSTGLMTLSGSATLANYQTALRSVKYNNSSDDPSTLARTVSFVVNDGGSANNLSNTITSAINITAVNDPPTANAFANLPAQAGIPITYPAGKLGGTDLEAGTTITIDTTAINVTNGTVTLNANGGFTFTATPAAAGGSASFQYRVYDNGNPSGGPSPSGGVFSTYVTVSFNVAGPAIYFSKSTGSGTACTLGNECLLSVAADPSHANGNPGRHIFINDAGNQSPSGVTLLVGNTVMGQGASGTTFAALYGISAPAQGTLATLPSLGQTPPTIGAVVLATSSTVRGLGISVSSGTALSNSAAISTAVVTQTSLTNTGGSALAVSSITAANINIDNLTASGGSASGVSIVNGSGTYSLATTGGSITGNLGSTSFNVSGGTNTISYAGTIAQHLGNKMVNISGTSGGGVTLSGTLTCDTSCTGINVSTNSSGSPTFTFSGGTKTLTTAANPAVTLNGNSTSTINFSNGGLGITTTSGKGIDATGGGTISVTTGTNANTISSTTGTALNVASTTIGASGLTFQSISAGTAGSGPVNGIILNNTGAGGLTVAGNGSAGTGGTIQKTTGNAIDLTSAGPISLSWMIIQNGTHLGINGVTLGGFTLANSSVLNNGTIANADHGIKLLDVSGTATFTSNTVTGNHVTNLFFGGTVSSTTVTNSLTVTGGTYGSSFSNSGIQVGMTHTSTLKTATFTNVTFSGNASTGLQVQSNDNSIVGDGIGAPATGTVTVSGCTFTNNAGNTAIDIDQGGGNGAGQMYARIMNNLTITGNGGPAINIFTSSSATGGTMKVRIDGNHVGNAAVSGSGSTMGPGIRVFLQGKTTNTITIVNNIVRQTPGARAIDVEALGPVTTGQALTVSDIVITGNDANTNDQANPSGSLAAIYVAADNQGSPAQINAAIHGNTIPSSTGANGSFDYPSFNGFSPWLYYRIHTSGGVAKLFNFGGHADANAEISLTQTSGTAGADISGFGGVQLTATAVNSVP